jgi:hypothetical protein
MEIADRTESMVGETGKHPSESALVRISIPGMPDAELLRFGMHAKFKCALEANPDDPRMTTQIAQLAEARAEWNRRHPALPLRDSF